MFAKFTVVLSTLAVLAAAIPTPDVSQCNTGASQCCNTVGKANSPAITQGLGLLDVVLGPVSGLVGLDCTPINVLALGQSANCAQQPVCCQGNEFNGLVNIGCTPISL